MTEQSVAFTVASGEAGERIDAVLARHAEVTRTWAPRARRSGSITVNGTAARPSQRVEEGDEVAGTVPLPTFTPPEAEDIPLDVRYSDERVLVISKPPGLVTHPASGHESGTLVNALLGLGGTLSGKGSTRPGIVHRLDKDTSGLLLVARDDDAWTHLVEALRRREVERRYLALVRGEPGAASGTIDAPMGRHPVHRRKMAIVPEGRRAVSHYRTLRGDGKATLLEVTLETGRTHQIRVHLAHLGHPVLGDKTYGGWSDRAAELGLRRPFLHAYQLAFPHPDDNRRIEVEDPLPEDLTTVLAALGI